MATTRFLVAVFCVLALVQGQKMPPAKVLACSGCEIVVRRIMFDLESYHHNGLLSRTRGHAERVLEKACPRLPTKTAAAEKHNGDWMYVGPKLAKQTSKFKKVINRPEQVKTELKAFCEKMLKDNWEQAVDHTMANWGLNLRNRMCHHWTQHCPSETPMQPRKYGGRHVDDHHHPDQEFHPEWGIPLAGNFEAPPPNLHEWQEVGREGIRVEL